MQVLNTNINDDLIFDNDWTVISQTPLDNVLSVRGGGGIAAGRSGAIRFYGDMYAPPPMAGCVEVVVPDAAHTIDVGVCVFAHNAGVPLIDMLSHRITKLAAPTSDEDALRREPWQAWNPTLTWTGGNPAGITTVARYLQVANIIFYRIQISSGDSNACTNLTITLPTTPSNSGGISTCSARQRYGVAGADYDTISFYNLHDGAGNTLITTQFHACTDGQAVGISMSGFYEA